MARKQIQKFTSKSNQKTNKKLDNYYAHCEIRKDINFNLILELESPFVNQKEHCILQNNEDHCTLNNKDHSTLLNSEDHCTLKNKYHCNLLNN